MSLSIQAWEEGARNSNQRGERRQRKRGRGLRQKAGVTKRTPEHTPGGEKGCRQKEVVTSGHGEIRTPLPQGEFFHKKKRVSNQREESQLKQETIAPEGS